MLAAQLAEAGVLRDPRWRAAMEQTPRHVFVPKFYRQKNMVLDSADPATAGAWLDGVYSDDSLVVQSATVPGLDLRLATSSSTMPSLMIRMLELLEVTDESSVLEIGTATGYNAALLCHRLDGNQVASIELHAGLAACAAEHLHSLGHRPTLAVGDGADGLPDRSPYDRIIATCAVPAIPPAWIDQLTPGGRIVTDLRSEMSSTLAVLDKTDADTVAGRLLEQPGHFMWLRPDPNNPLPDPSWFSLGINVDDAETSHTDLDPGVLNEPGLRVLLGILEPSLQKPTKIRRGGCDLWSLHAADNCWAEFSADARGTVTQGGPRRLWSSIEHATAEWNRLGRPGRDGYGLTATADGIHRYWVTQPDRTILTSTAASVT